MKNETHVTASTRINGVSHKSNVTINWDGMTEDDVQALAQRSLIIKKQNADRVAGIVPESSYTLLASDYKIGTRVVKAPLTLDQILAAIPADERAKMIEAALAKL